jgi:hypothetical protein
MTIATGERLLASDINNLTFFPKGTVLMYSSTAWNSVSAEFKALWHICDGATVNGYTTLNLVDKFIRGGAVSGQTGGTDSAEVPRHSHRFTGGTATGSFMPITRADIASSGSATGVFTTSGTSSRNRGADWYGGESGHHTVNFSMTPTGTISEEGSATADNKPAYCTVIFIEKVV